MAQTEANDRRQQLIGYAEIGLYIICLIAFLIWIHGANSQARRLGALGMKFTPGWSVGWFFVPFANLWQPYRVVREIWRASAAPQNWATQPSSPLIGFWWALWVGTNIYSYSLLRFAMNTDTVEGFQSLDIFRIVGNGLNIVLCLLTIILVRRIWVLQTAERIQSIIERF